METIDKVSDLQQQPNVGANAKQIVHVRGDSETELDLLFSVLNSRDQKPQTRPFKDMKLPPSFFRPPDPKPAGYHSREGSLDGVSAANQLIGGNVRQQGTVNVNVFHARSHSSPAQLPLAPLSVAPSPGHLKQGSADAGGGLPSVESGISGQQQQIRGWPAPSANSNQHQNNNKYFISNTNTNGLWPQETRTVVNSPNKPALVNNNQSGNVQQNNLGPLPAGWEQGVTAEGDIYYINHIEKTTSWFDPRLPKNIQKSVPVKVAAVHSGRCNPQQVASRAGTHIQPVHNSQPTANEQLIQMELQKLQKERERLQREQEENNRREQLLLKELSKLKTGNHIAQTGGVNESLHATGLHQLVSTGVDPFLGQSAIVNNSQSMNDSHGRPTSADLARKTSTEMSQLQASGCLVDMPMLGVDTSESLAMDSDDLVSSFSGELGMDVQMMENIIQYI